MVPSIASSVAASITTTSNIALHAAVNAYDADGKGDPGGGGDPSDGGGGGP